jgi:hypothetical protein
MFQPFLKVTEKEQQASLLGYEINVVCFSSGACVVKQVKSQLSKPASLLLSVPFGWL